MANPLNSFVMDTSNVPQSEQADSRQVKNNAGGFTFVLTDVERIKRFLIIGSDKTYYQSGQGLTRENALHLIDFLGRSSEEEQNKLLDLIENISVEGRAPKQSPALFALALVISQSKFDSVKNAGYGKINAVCRTGSTFLEFFGYLTQFQRFGMGARKAIARWYTGFPEASQLAYQVAKYRSRGKLNHRDLLYLSKRVRTEKDALDPSVDATIKWVTGNPYNETLVPAVIQGLEKAKLIGARGKDAAREYANLIEEYGLTWEMLPTEALNEPGVWAELILGRKIPLTALMRNLGKITSIGTFANDAVRESALRQLRDVDLIRRSRIHPVNVLVTWKTYASGRGLKGSLTWRAQPEIVSALEAMYSTAFGNVEPTGKRVMLGLDVSGSMQAKVAGTPLSALEVEAAIAQQFVNTEEQLLAVAFSDRLVNLALTPDMRLNDTMNAFKGIRFGRTDCALPMLAAMHNKIAVDLFIVITDAETWYGQVHPHEALKQYREASGIDAKLIVLATTSTGFTIADPSDPGMLDLVGFDLSMPKLISEFAKGF